MAGKIDVRGGVKKEGLEKINRFFHTKKELIYFEHCVLVERSPMGSRNFHFPMARNMYSATYWERCEISNTPDILTKVPDYLLNATFASSQVYDACDSRPSWVVVPVLSTTTVRITGTLLEFDFFLAQSNQPLYF
jgi:hypothetical protein